MWAWLIPLARVLHHPLVFVVIVCLALACWVAGLYFYLQARVITQPSRFADKERFQTRYYSAATAFVVLVAIGAATMGLATVAATAQFAPQLSSGIGSVTVDGQSVPAPDRLVAAIRSMHDVPGHHSHPQPPGFVVRLSTQRGPLAFTLERDSSDPHEYWTLYSGLDGTPVEVGHVFTDQLDGR